MFNTPGNCKTSYKVIVKARDIRWKFARVTKAPFSKHLLRRFSKPRGRWRRCWGSIWGRRTMRTRILSPWWKICKLVQLFVFLCLSVTRTSLLWSIISSRLHGPTGVLREWRYDRTTRSSPTTTPPHREIIVGYEEGMLDSDRKEAQSGDLVNFSQRVSRCMSTVCMSWGNKLIG